MSSGCAEYPDEDTTYGTFSSPGCRVPMDDCGRVEGIFLYVYGRVVAVGREMNGETVNGT